MSKYFRYKGNKYTLLGIGKMKHPETKEWIEAVMYASSKGDFYSREKKEFEYKFIEERKSDQKLIDELLLKENSSSQTIAKPNVSGSATDFEKELFELINSYVSAGLKKQELCHKMRFVTISCERS